jgi:hypothetical protein
MKILILSLITLLCLLVACGGEVALPVATPTVTVEPTPTFEAAKYGTAVTDLTYCEPEGKPQKMDIWLFRWNADRFSRRRYSETV